VVWSNPDLKILDLEMMFEPVFKKGTKHPNRIIDVNFMVFPTIDLSDTNDSSTSLSVPAESSYLGRAGSGMLDDKFGSGEYLDVEAITEAQKAAANAGTLSQTNLRYLPVQVLRLGNIIVDGLPFERWFCPTAIKRIEFKHGCIDAGFFLPVDMKHAIIKVPAQLVKADDEPLAEAVKVDNKPGELKLLEIKDCKVTSCVAAPAPVPSAPMGPLVAAGARSPASTSTATATAKQSALGRLKSTMVKGFGWKKFAAAAAANEEEKGAAVPAAAVSAVAAAAEGHAESFVHVERPAVPARGSSLGCFGTFTKAEIEEAKKGKKAAE
jgi:hypothetical protein